MKSKDIRELSPEEINVKIGEASEQLLGMRLRKQTGQVEKTHALRSLRKDIARFKTILVEKNKTAAAKK